jgi:hypothetical protein
MVAPQAMEQLLRPHGSRAISAGSPRERRRPSRLTGIRSDAFRSADTWLVPHCRVGLQSRRRKLESALHSQRNNRPCCDSIGYARRPPGPRPESIDPDRRPYEYKHFGYGLHTSFGIRINKALLPLMLKRVVQRQGLRRAAGQDGQLSSEASFQTGWCSTSTHDYPTEIEQSANA